MPSFEEKPALMPEKSAAALLGISPSTFRRRVADETLPKPIRLGGRTLWSRKALLDAVGIEEA